MVKLHLKENAEGEKKEKIIRRAANGAVNSFG